MGKNYNADVVSGEKDGLTAFLLACVLFVPSRGVHQE
jgi:hypothetical protein